MDNYTIEQARKLADFTVREMASKLGMSVGTYISKEKYRTKFYYEDACHFAEIVNIPVDRILFTSTIA